MTTIDLPRPDRALAIGAHPDDIEFGAGATLATWAAAGTAVSLVVLTDGSKGSWDDDADLATLVAVRETEARAAANALGAVEIEFLRRVDGELDDSIATRAEICAAIRRTRPDVVVAHDPWKRYRLHPDHRIAGQLTLDAIVAARDPHFFPEQPHPPHRPLAALLFEAQDGRHVESVAAGAVDAKIAALLSHRSQFRSTMGFEAGDDEAMTAFSDRIRREAADVGRGVGVPAGERFARIDEI